MADRLTHGVISVPCCVSTSCTVVGTGVPPHVLQCTPAAEYRCSPVLRGTLLPLRPPTTICAGAHVATMPRRHVAWGQHVLATALGARVDARVRLGRGIER